MLISFGLYLAKRRSEIKPALLEHYGLLDIGNLLGFPEGVWTGSALIHQAYPYLRVEPLHSLDGWELLGRVSESEMNNVRTRINESLRRPIYDLFSNNCEHFARFAATGSKQSAQLQRAVAVSCILAAFLYAGSQ